MCKLKGDRQMKKWMWWAECSRIKNNNNHWKKIAFIVGSCAGFQSFGIHSSMNAKSTIKKLQWITREKGVWSNEHK